MFPTLTLSGAPFERGQQHGSQASAQINQSIASYARLFAYQRGIDWAAVQTEALSYSDAIANFDSTLWDEMQGIAAGSGHSFATILALNARTELLAGTRPGLAHPNYSEAVSHNRAAFVPDHSECTALAVLPQASATSEPILAQNWDWHGDQRAACILLRIHAPGLPVILTLTEAGIVGKIGLNDAGLGICLNILQSRLDGQKPGVPVHILLRAMLGKSTLAEATALATSVQPGASSNLLCADTNGEAISIEITPAGSGIINPKVGLLIHTNHCISPETCPVASPLMPSSSSEPRYNRAQQMLTPQIGSISRDDVIAVLRDESEGLLSICRHPDLSVPVEAQIETVAAVVMDLAAHTMYVAPDIPSQVEFSPVSL
ncbi:MAG: C45 family peptidase [Chloroflexota bacterium]